MRFSTCFGARADVLPSTCAKPERNLVFGKRVGVGLSVALLAVSLSGCVGFGRGHGLGPIIDATSVESASNNRQRILQALAKDAFLDLVAPSDWYLVAEAGFNYIDDQCKAYFYEQYLAGSGKAGVTSGLAAASPPFSPGSDMAAPAPIDEGIWG